MATTTIDITCPECGKASKGPAELRGKKIKCKQCQTVFLVPAGGAVKAVARPAKAGAATAIPLKKDEEEEDGPARNPYGVTEEDLAVRCPFCALAMDPPDSKVCLHCGYDMVKRRRLESKKTVEITAGDYLLYHIPTMLCFIGICIMIALDVLTLLNAENWMRDGWFDNGDGTWLVRPGIIPLYVFLATTFLGVVPMGRIMIRRLVRFTPPEVVIKDKDD